MAHRRPSWLSKAGCAGFALGLMACEKAPPPIPDPATLPKRTETRAATSVFPPAEIAAAGRAWLKEPENGRDSSAEERRALERIYPASSPAPIWVDETWRLTPSAQGALRALVDAAAEGLDPADYRGEALSTLGRATVASSPPAPRAVAAFDLGLSLSMLRYLRHSHRGRVNPRDIGFLMTLPADEHDYAALVREAALKGRVKETIASITPPLVQYRILRSILPRYRALALAEDPTHPLLPRAPTKSVKPGGQAPALEILRSRLIAIGDLPVTTAPLADPNIYGGELVEGVKRFQIRHGLEGDGILGRTTWAALNVPLRFRVRQIELAMERMRWLPHLGARAFIAVNIPMFRLWGWDSVPETGAPAFEMGVIVGKALNTRTPVFMEEMKHLIFRPYWNVPRSILHKEILPILRRDLAYLSRQDMEMVDGQGDDARPMAPTSENVVLLARGKLRLRQRPGPRNALGAVKFMFPNDENVYLHGTPAPGLFGRARRDFSHGCVRVENPLALAEWALKDQPQWTRKRIQAAMEGRPSLVAPLTRPIRVVLYYVTATVIPGDNSIHFAEDIYGHDPRLDKALAARRKSS